MPVVNIFSI